MDATDLERQDRTRSGCIPPELVSKLLERGHIDEVELYAGRGEWFCALAWARLLGEQGWQADASPLEEAGAPAAATTPQSWPPIPCENRLLGYSARNVSLLGPGSGAGQLQFRCATGGSTASRSRA
ncbi:hypothetical protein GFH48_38205 [Streptomyces fagopyri]|uniref:Uncharacterized protein n=1 Tax=Streptomyces fagopyri TaxID=2662397 RepID=A0A5Q0LM66_9ACTN|nr:hypothetical protein GFH48_38205 [Streptomyces fagopyri]